MLPSITHVLRLENDIMMEMERRREVPAMSEAIPRAEYLEPETSNDLMFG